LTGKDENGLVALPSLTVRIRSHRARGYGGGHIGPHL